MKQSATKKIVRTAILTPLQVREAILDWARLHRAIGTYEDVTTADVKLSPNGSASIKRVKRQL